MSFSAPRAPQRFLLTNHWESFNPNGFPHTIVPIHTCAPQNFSFLTKNQISSVSSTTNENKLLHWCTTPNSLGYIGAHLKYFFGSMLGRTSNICLGVYWGAPRIFLWIILGRTLNISLERLGRTSNISLGRFGAHLEFFLGALRGAKKFCAPMPQKKKNAVTPHVPLQQR